MKKKYLLIALSILLVGTAIVVWAAESAPSNTVGFFSYQLDTSP